jgi:protein gp37
MDLTLINDLTTAEDGQVLNEIVQIEEQAPHLCGQRFAVIKERHPDDWYDVCKQFCEDAGKKIWSKRHIKLMMNYSVFITNVIGNSCSQIPKEGLVRPLAALPAPDQKGIWEDLSPNGKYPDPKTVKDARKKYDVTHAQPKTKKGTIDKRVFNFTNENIDWAKWSWNPVTGCKTGCPYCYARDIATRFSTFEPTEHMHRLAGPKLTKIPEKLKDEPGINNVFVCSMADLFGEWVPEEWVQHVFNACRDNPKWTYIFLTKNPSRLAQYEWADNWWVGTTVDCQSRVAPAEAAFENVRAKVRFVSLEPFNEKISFTHLDRFNWVIIGGRSKSSKMKAFQPESRWVERVVYQARKAECQIYFKPNLEYRPKEYPVT